MIISFITGSTLGTWFKLLKKARFRIDLRYLHRALFLTFTAALNSVMALRDRKYKSRIDAVEIKEGPVFIIGCWRSGTTLLHNLIAEDSRFGFLTTAQALYPHSFLSNEKLLKFILQKALPETRPQDNVTIGVDSPQENEVAMSSMTPFNMNQTMNFPRQDEVFFKYLDFDGVPAKELDSWGETLEYLVKKVSFSCGNKPLVLKSPAHTSLMIKIMEVFPNAKFLHIVRNPYEVYNSLKGLFQTFNDVYLRLQDAKDESWRTQWVLMAYERLYNAYLDQLPEIPKDKIYTVRYDDLIKDPVKEIRNIYKTLSLPDFKVFEPHLKSVVEKNSKFKRNNYKNISPEELSVINKRWVKYFKAWGYPVNGGVHNDEIAPAKQEKQKKKVSV